ncbi:MAG: amidohydrolase [Bacteroidetes bacterium]|nr:amidohydrolase [Bacteroidota bacterium]
MYFGYLLLSTLLLFSCGTSKIKVDFIVTNAKVYTADGGFAILESFAVNKGKIVGVGTNESIAISYDTDSILDVKGKTILPGIIDAHCHFLAYGLGLQECNLVGTKSFTEVIERLKKYTATNKQEWTLGRGWDQNDWAIKEYPTNKILDSLFPGQPIVLERIDGHAVLASNEALRRSKITDYTIVDGGEIVRASVNSQATGILIDNAVNLVTNIIPKPDFATFRNAILNAQKECLAVGITTVDDAGLLKWQVDQIDKMQQQGELKMRVYAILSDAEVNYKHYLNHGPYKTDLLNVRAFKFYADGALGSRGACLLKLYDDKKDWSGLLINTSKHFEEKMKILAQKNFQVCTHCIGDSANRLILSIYGKILSDTLITKNGTQARWRIEHAQIVHPNDLKWIEKYKIIPSVQPTHATSDMYWAAKRLGLERIKTAYAYNDLLKSAGLLALGTDFPVENINPMFTFYAAVARMDQAQFPAGGFQIENALSRRNTLLGMTAWAAYANFEENEKGSIEAGKFADFIILDTDPMICELNKIPKIKVLSTYINGEKVYTQNEK